MTLCNVNFTKKDLQKYVKNDFGRLTCFLLERIYSRDVLAVSCISGKRGNKFANDSSANYDKLQLDPNKLKAIKCIELRIYIFFCFVKLT